MRVLSIETSCDETAIAILDISGASEKPDIKVLGNTLLSQIELHEQYGGVYPNLAKREHEKNLPILLEQTLKEANEDPDNPNIDCIAVTQGPGLEPALWTGITFAEKLSEKWQKPVVPVNHMEGHIFSVLYNIESKLELPALALLVSGGHTELVHIKDFGQYEILGRTRDDAVGEAFDKVARMLGLPYPGGPQISKLAKVSRDKASETEFKFPRPMLHSHDLNFSYSGLKTAVLYKLKSLGDIDDDTKGEIARAFEDAAVDVLIEKTRTALENLEGEVKTFIVAGGVSANTHLQNRLSDLIETFPNIKLLKPASLLTTDNAIMIAIAAFVKVNSKPEIILPQVLGTQVKALGNLLITSWQ